MPGFGVDIEITNRCNADCSFCPRDATPHQGLMSEETFDKALDRTLEYRQACTDVFGFATVDTVDLCGLGEPLLHKHAPKFVRQVREAGLRAQLNTNAALLNEKKATALLDAGLQRVLINVGEINERYEEVYKLPFAKTRDNVVRFWEMAKGRCEVEIVLVDHQDDGAHINELQQYWQGLGVDRFRRIGLMNRGGALYVDHMQYQQYPELATATQLLESRSPKPLCVAPFAFLFVGYDGQYYLCCSDWKKEAALGHVFDKSFVDVIAEKVRLITTREKVCRTCSSDPANQLTDMLRAREQGEVTDDAIEKAVDHMHETWSVWTADPLERLSPGCTDVAPTPPDGRKLIPLTVTE